MALIATVDRWRSLAVEVYETKIKPIPMYVDLPRKLKEIGIPEGDFINLILGIFQKESSGNEFTLGDWEKGYPRKYPIETYDEALLFIDGANSIGLGQLNFGAGTPQSLGYEGTKEGLLDPATNIFYAELYFLAQLKKYGDVEKALSAYNAGHATQINQASYVDVILNFLKDVGGAAQKKIS